MTVESKPSSAKPAGASLEAHGGTVLQNHKENAPSGLVWYALAAPSLIAFVMALWWQSQTPQRDLFLSLNHWAANFPPMTWSIFTTLGDASVLFCVLSPLLVWRPRMMFAILAAVPLGGLLSVSLKALFQAPRPATLIDLDQFNLIGPLLNNASFPSGHTISAFAAAVALVATMQLQTRSSSRPVRIAAASLAILALAALVGLSRVAVGAHWPVDVLAGAACGWLAGVSGAWAAQRYPKVWQATLSQFVVGQLLLLTALWLLLKKPEYPQGAPAVWLAVACVLATVVWQFLAMYRALQASRNNSTSARKPVV